MVSSRARRRRSSRAGYSLLEIIIVVAIIGLLVTLVGPQLFGRLDQSKQTTAEAQVRMLRSALDSYRLDVGAYPPEADGLAALVNAPGDSAEQWRGPYLDGGQLPLDPWGRPYNYAPEGGAGGAPAIFSYGADGRPGGDGINKDVGVLPQGAVS